MELIESRLKMNKLVTDGYLLSSTKNDTTDVLFIAKRSSLPSVATMPFKPEELYVVNLQVQPNKLTRYWGTLPALPCVEDSEVLLLGPERTYNSRKPVKNDVPTKLEIVNYVRETHFKFPQTKIEPSSTWTGYDAIDEYNKSYSVLRYGGRRSSPVLNLAQGQAALMDETTPLASHLFEPAMTMLEILEESRIAGNGVLYTTQGFSAYGS